ncbi:MAG: hypothetical protein GY765_16940, partial [bacterium]|nr:hypothetical protein [bacterium]
MNLTKPLAEHDKRPIPTRLHRNPTPPYLRVPKHTPGSDGRFTSNSMSSDIYGNTTMESDLAAPFGDSVQTKSKTVTPGGDTITVHNTMTVDSSGKATIVSKIITESFGGLSIKGRVDLGSHDKGASDQGLATPVRYGSDYADGLATPVRYGSDYADGLATPVRYGSDYADGLATP